MNQRAYVIIFTIALCSLAAGLLKAAAEATRETIEANARYEKALNIADVLGVDFDKSDPKETLQPYFEELFEKQVVEVAMEPFEVEGIGKIEEYVFYKYYKSAEKKEEDLVAYACPIGGGGFQDYIGGYLGVTADQKSIAGISFYNSKETPGLGGRIISDATEEDREIRQQFKKKSIYLTRQTEDGNVVVNFAMVSPAFITEKNAVCRTESITGATQTSNAITTFLPRDIAVFYKALELRGEKTVKQEPLK